MCKQSNRVVLLAEVQKLRESGALPKLVSAGLLSPKAVTYLHIAERVAEVESRYKRTTRGILINNIAAEFRVSNATVYRAINVMCKPLHTNENKGNQ